MQKRSLIVYVGPKPSGGNGVPLRVIDAGSLRSYNPKSVTDTGDAVRLFWGRDFVM